MQQNSDLPYENRLGAAGCRLSNAHVIRVVEHLENGKVVLLFRLEKNNYQQYHRPPPRRCRGLNSRGISRTGNGAKTVSTLIKNLIKFCRNDSPVTQYNPTTPIKKWPRQRHFEHKPRAHRTDRCHTFPRPPSSLRFPPTATVFHGVFFFGL